MEAFTTALESRIETMEETRIAIVRLEDCQRTLSVAKEYAENFLATQDIYKQYKKSKDPEKFLRSHETEILIHETAKNQLKAMDYPEVPHPKKIEKEMAVLESGDNRHSESGEKSQSESSNKNQSPGLCLLN